MESVAPSLRRLSTRQQQALDFIDASLAAGTGFPSPSDIADHMGWRHAQSASDCLHKLRWRGLLKVAKDYSWQRVPDVVV